MFVVMASVAAFGSADDLAQFCEHGSRREMLRSRFRDAKVNDLDNGQAIVQRDHHIGGLDVSVYNTLLMSVLYRMADVDEELQSSLESRFDSARRNAKGVCRFVTRQPCEEA